MTAVPDLAAWLRDEITRTREAAVKAGTADGRYGGRAQWSARYGTIVTDERDPDWAVLDLSPCIDDRDAGEHVALNDPASVIARCEAELAILDEHAPKDWGYEAAACQSCCDWERDGLPHTVAFPCRTVRLLGNGYRHRAGYDSSWAP